MTNGFRERANELRRKGAVASRAQGRNVPGFHVSSKSAALALAGAAAAAATLIINTFIVAFPSAPSHLWHGRIAALDRFANAGVDLSKIEPEEFRAFSATRPDDRMALIGIARYWPPEAQLTLIELANRSAKPADTFFTMTSLAYLLKGSPARQRLAFAVTEVDETDAAHLVTAVDPVTLLKALVADPKAAARLLVDRSSTQPTAGDQVQRIEHKSRPRLPSQDRVNDAATRAVQTGPRLSAERVRSQHVGAPRDTVSDGRHRRPRRKTRPEPPQ